MNRTTLHAGAAVVDITPKGSVFLHGYPRVRRYSTGVHDPLLCTALALENGGQAVVFIANDMLFVSKSTAAGVRSRVAAETGVPAEDIIVTCSHTHSGPVVIDPLFATPGSVVPLADQAYIAWWADQMVACVAEAWRTRRPAELSHAMADATGIGTNRHDPNGPSCLQTPVLIARDAGGGKPIGVMLVCSMHPTVLHEDSTLISGDFPAASRLYLQRQGLDCPIVYHIGAAGDQSPRHVTRGNTFAEADRLGEILGRAVERAIRTAEPVADPQIGVECALLDLPMRPFPAVDVATHLAVDATERFESLRLAGASRTKVRTAECDMFGADATLALARAAADGALTRSAAAILPAEITAIAIGHLRLVAWPGEVLVTFADRIRGRYPNTGILTMANGELRGYVVTQQAIDERWYEAGNALLQSPDVGERLVESTLALLQELKTKVLS